MRARSREDSRPGRPPSGGRESGHTRGRAGPGTGEAGAGTPRAPRAQSGRAGSPTATDGPRRPRHRVGPGMRTGPGLVSALASADNRHPDYLSIRKWNSTWGGSADWLSSSRSAPYPGCRSRGAGAVHGAVTAQASRISGDEPSGAGNGRPSRGVHPEGSSGSSPFPFAF